MVETRYANINISFKPKFCPECSNLDKVSDGVIASKYQMALSS